MKVDKKGYKGYRKINVQMRKTTNYLINKQNNAQDVLKTTQQRSTHLVLPVLGKEAGGAGSGDR